MIICEYEFDQPDKDNPKYSQTEVDYYAHIPYPMAQSTGVGQHRLSLRKNLQTGKYEIYRAWSKSYLASRKSLSILTNSETGDTEVVYSGDLKGAISFAIYETNKFWKETFGAERAFDQICLHKPPVQHWFCAKLKERRKPDEEE